MESDTLQNLEDRSVRDLCGFALPEPEP
ncbi:hypothetical protein Bhyg_10762 [Pseudolycoriella hygida]|uniref:Uncharacterized protein n=1 Tax=Pseudolycoriella hygida TaxID=35572 RepID=A0A9Q0MVD8_9DIPT|nr:hypothetical protein Bhyg_10762 [Pseudolycoriella hygida]